MAPVRVARHVATSLSLKGAIGCGLSAENFAGGCWQRRRPTQFVRRRTGHAKAFSIFWYTTIQKSLHRPVSLICLLEQVLWAWKPCPAVRVMACSSKSSAEGRGLIRTNVETFGLLGNTKIFRRDATKLGEAGTIEPFDLVFADPPYGKGLGKMAFRSALDGGWLNPDTLLVLEEEAEAMVDLDPRFSVVEERPYGGTIIRLITLKS